MEKQESNEDIQKMLSESGYSDKAIKYFQAQENMGVIDGADQVTDLTGPCGDTMKVYLSIDGERIKDARIQVLGCPGAVASGCALMNIAKGRTVEEAGKIGVDELYRELEKLPDQKIHCARLAVKTLQKALKDYTNGAEERAGGKRQGEEG